MSEFYRLDKQIDQTLKVHTKIDAISTVIETKDSWSQTEQIKEKKASHVNCNNRCICNNGLQSINFWEEYTRIYNPKKYRKRNFQIPKTTSITDANYKKIVPCCRYIHYSSL